VKTILSVIIVSYNAKYYLNLTLSCLDFISKSLPLEVIVVDNKSSTKEIEFNQFSFPNFKFIHNKENLGFSKANNIGVKLANSKNILILNPDTIISQSAIESALKILNADAKTGAVSLKMLDGSGEFLPESIRSFPDLKSSIFKFIGLHKFSTYYKGKFELDKIEVMSGACMFFKKNVYEEIGGFDERYFMYGEDIDISYQLIQNGYHAKYIEDKEIIHFKGKSSVKSNWNYQQSFYNAMYLYWQKNINQTNNFILSLIAKTIMFFMKLVSFIKHTVGIFILPVLDFLGIIFASSIVSHIWAIYFKEDGNFFPLSFYIYILPIYAIVSLSSFFIHRFYTFEIDLSRLLKAAILNFCLILFVYFILPSDYKYSRAVLVYYSFISIFIPIAIRSIYSIVMKRKILFSNSQQLISNLDNLYDLDKLKSTIHAYSHFKLLQNNSTYENIILNINDSKPEIMIDLIKTNQNKKMIWLYSPLKNYLIQSHGKNSTGYIIAQDTNLVIDEFSSRFAKRIFDVLISVLFILFGYICQLKYFKYVYQSLLVLLGNKTWILPNNQNTDCAVFYLSDDISDDYKRNYSLKLDLYYIYQYMFIS
jgi:O-antigen biosynthesis protein